MSVWSTKALNRNSEFIVVKHKLRGINYTVKGIKFRDGFAVVEKDSKTYFELKKLPVLRNMEEFPLLHLRKLKFITRTADVKLIFGQDVYRVYLAALQIALDNEAEQAEEALVIAHAEQEVSHLTEDVKCHFRSPNSGELCNFPYLKKSLSKYCTKHILEDPKLEEMGFEKVPRFISKKERQELKEKIANKLRE
jgi:hypothetical protein